MTYLSSHLFSLLSSPLFPTDHTKSSAQDTTIEALNCLRVLGRIIVVAYENDADIRASGVEAESFAQKYLWSRTKVETPPTHKDVSEDAIAEAAHFEIGDDDEDVNADEGAGAGQEEDEIDEGARAFKATIGNPPKDGKASETIDDPLSKPGEPADEVEEEPTVPCLIDRLFSCTIDLLFCAGFTLPESVRGTDSTEKINVGVLAVCRGIY